MKRPWHGIHSNGNTRLAPASRAWRREGHGFRHYYLVLILVWRPTGILKGKVI